MEEKVIFKRSRLLCLPLVVSLIFMLLSGVNVLFAQEKDCEPSREENLSRSYQPDAPIRSKVGEGYVLSGEVMSSAGCVPVQDAQIEFWLAGAGGYNNSLRGVMISNEEGGYHLESIRPGGSGSFRGHIHFRVSASGFRPLAATHIVGFGEDEEKFDFVLTPLPL